MQQNPYKVIMGKGRLAAINKKVGERIKVTSLNYQDLDLEVEICGELPGARYDENAVMNFDYLDAAIQAYNQGKAEGPAASDDREIAGPGVSARAQHGRRTIRSPRRSRFLAGIPLAGGEVRNAFLGHRFVLGSATRILLFGLRWLLVPSLLVTISLVIANAISISVRERRVEMAVLKVLGFSPNQILMLVLSRGAADRLHQRRASAPRRRGCWSTTCSAASRFRSDSSAGSSSTSGPLVGTGDRRQHGVDRQRDCPPGRPDR